MCESTTSISNGNFDVRVESNNSNEIEILVKSFNTMVVKIKDLMDKSMKEQEQINKSELKALQAGVEKTPPPDDGNPAEETQES